MRLYNPQYWSVGPSHFYFFGVNGVFGCAAPAQMLHCPCPTARDWGSRVYGLVYKIAMVASIVRSYLGILFGLLYFETSPEDILKEEMEKDSVFRSEFLGEANTCANTCASTNKGGYSRPEKSRKWEPLFPVHVLWCMHLMLSG